jgi:hypothetical protein
VVYKFVMAAAAERCAIKYRERERERERESESVLRVDKQKN